MTQTDTMTIRLDADIKHQLEKLAEDTNRSRSFLAAEAITHYVKMNVWQISEINKRLKGMDDQSEFASDTEVEGVFRKYA